MLHRFVFIIIDLRYTRQAHSRRMFVAPTRWLLLQDRRMLIDNDKDVNVSFAYDTFEDLAIYPDSDVVLARRFDPDFLELMSVYRPSPQRGMILENRGNWTAEDGLRMRTFDVASARRRNLQRTILKSSLVVSRRRSSNLELLKYYLHVGIYFFEFFLDRR